MAARKKSAVKKETVVKQTTNDVDDLREYAFEAEQVEMLKNHKGWVILERDFNLYKNDIANKLPYLNPTSKEFSEARVLFIVADKLLKIVEDYSENKKRYMELLNKLDNTKENIVLDVDN